jgi:hypothetical protein
MLAVYLMQQIDWARAAFLLNKMRDSGSESGHPKSSRELTLYYGHTEVVAYQLKKMMQFLSYT